MPRRRRRNINQPSTSTVEPSTSTVEPSTSTASTVEDISENLEECNISDDPPQPNIVLRSDIPPEVMACWPKPKPDVPALFLHKPGANNSHLLNLNRSLETDTCYVKCKKNYVKFNIKTFETHKFISRYLESNECPFHTFGYPNARMMKVVVRNLPIGTDLNSVKEHLQKVSVPVVAIHRMHTPEFVEHKTMLVLVVLPNTAEGQKMLRVTHILGTEVKLETAHVKTRQCHRCQMWGHSQRYCRGEEKCVKCAGAHLTSQCTKDPSEPAKCANCGGDHTANYKHCSYCPKSKEYKRTQREKRDKKKKRATNSRRMVN